MNKPKPDSPCALQAHPAGPVAQPRTRAKSLRHLLGLFCSALLLSCAQNYTVSVNEQAVFDPNDRLAGDQVGSPDLQGCINLTLRQRAYSSPAEISSLSCANSEISTLRNISRLTGLRFLDLGGNEISDLQPLGSLGGLSGLNLSDNRISDIAPLLRMPALVSVSLVGNPNIPCLQLQVLGEKLGNGLQRPQSCRR